MIETNGETRIILEDEEGFTHTYASIVIYSNGRFIGEYRTEKEYKQGWDGSWYSCAVFKKYLSEQDNVQIDK